MLLTKRGFKKRTLICVGYVGFNYERFEVIANIWLEVQWVWMRCWVVEAKRIWTKTLIQCILLHRYEGWCFGESTHTRPKRISWRQHPLADDNHVQKNMPYTCKVFLFKVHDKHYVSFSRVIRMDGWVPRQCGCSQPHTWSACSKLCWLIDSWCLSGSQSQGPYNRNRKQKVTHMSS